MHRKERPLRGIIGLGNVGRKYKNTRHNIGFMTMFALTEAKYSIPVYCPFEGMNHSGFLLKQLCDKKANVTNGNPEDYIIVYDDFNLPLGEIRYRSSGSAGGHNGMQSIITALGTENIPRIKMGIGPRPENVPTTDFVLGDFNESEWSTVKSMIQKVVGFMGLYEVKFNKRLRTHEFFLPDTMTDGEITKHLNGKIIKAKKEDSNDKSS